MINKRINSCTSACGTALDQFFRTRLTTGLSVQSDTTQAQALFTGFEHCTINPTVDSSEFHCASHSFGFLSPVLYGVGNDNR
jgi:hypothetical protein